MRENGTLNSTAKPEISLDRRIAPAALRAKAERTAHAVNPCQAPVRSRKERRRARRVERIARLAPRRVLG
jgi:hypothetical protein